MKNKRGMSAIIIIPMVVLMMAIVGVFAYKLYSEGTRTKAAEPAAVPKTLPSLKTTGNKPKGGYGTLAAPSVTVTPMAKPSQPAASMLENVDVGEIATSSSNGGADFTAVDKAISGL